MRGYPADPDRKRNCLNVNRCGEEFIILCCGVYGVGALKSNAFKNER